MKQIAYLLLVSLIAHTVNAQDVAPGEPSPIQGQTVDDRQARQEKRIENGIEKGSLTEAEAKKLNHQQKRIQKMENRAQADGTVTEKEQRRLNHAQNKANRDIRRKNHNKRH